ncbi:hypothetical protein HPB47_025592 [Ixodes persulcatus]|uniref:Uncharacterized protein n=1 Tax=Ixodes persulcatus TaxID=34615 RepID=A0AC60Q122_IXOPE|nr:hypothetical protein HPB47_025592 [Ixodes persulcatus]
MTGKIARQEVAVLVVYLLTWTSSGEKNSELVKCFERDYHKLGRTTIMMGDFNAHLEKFNERKDYNGKLLLDMVEHLDMEVVNTENKCTGTTTWTAREMSSTINYYLMSPDLYDKLRYMKLDEDGDRSLGSDHNWLLIALGRNSADTKESKTMGQCNVTQSEAQMIAEKLEAEAGNKQMETSGDIMQWWIHHPKKVERPTRRKGRKRKRWWDIKGQTGKPREDPMLKDDTMGIQLGPRETTQYTEERVRRMCAGSGTDKVDENGRPERQVEREVQPSMENITEGEQRKAIRRIESTTARGLDNLKMRLRTPAEDPKPDHERTTDSSRIAKVKTLTHIRGPRTQVLVWQLPSYSNHVGAVPAVPAEDNLSVLTLAIEIVQKENRPPYLCFLDVSKAYDTLAEWGLSGEWIDLLREVYRGTGVVAQWQQETTLPLTSTNGLSQGFPLSPLLFMPYIAEENGTTNLSIHANPLPWVDRYKYQGINLQTGHHYLLEHETKVKAKSRRNKGIATAKALWGYNRYEVIRAVWKMVAVPGLTFGNAVLCLSSCTYQYLEVRQMEVGRPALGASRTVPNEVVQGDMGWSSFEAREVRAKLGCYVALFGLPGDLEEGSDVNK